MSKDKTQPLAPLHRPHGAPAIVSRDLRSGFYLYSELARRGEFNLFPADLPPALVRDHLQAHLAEEIAHTDATQSQASAVKSRAQLERKAKLVRLQVLDAVDGTFPPGNPLRGDFFPPGQADHLLSQYLISLGKGMAKHPLASLPDSLSAADVLGLGQTLAQAEEALAEARNTKGVTSTTRANLEPLTASIASRLGALVRSRHGRTSKELAAYGLKVQSAQRGRKSARAKSKPGIDGAESTGATELART